MTYHPVFGRIIAAIGFLAFSNAQADISQNGSAPAPGVNTNAVQLAMAKVEKKAPLVVGECAAWENHMPPVGQTIPLIVVCDVETGAANLIPKLTMANPQGFNPAILLLNLTVEDTGGAGAQVVAAQTARYETQIVSGAYTSVTILWEDGGADVEVTKAH
jgi:hypothetical protein